MTAEGAQDNKNYTNKHRDFLILHAIRNSDNYSEYWFHALIHYMVLRKLMTVPMWAHCSFNSTQYSLRVCNTFKSKFTHIHWTWIKSFYQVITFKPLPTVMRQVHHRTSSFTLKSSHKQTNFECADITENLNILLRSTPAVVLFHSIPILFFRVQCLC